MVYLNSCLGRFTTGKYPGTRMGPKAGLDVMDIGKASCLYQDSKTWSSEPTVVTIPNMIIY